MRRRAALLLPLLLGAAGPRDYGLRPAPPAAPLWTESATRDFRDGALRLAWKRPGGDWVDAAGAVQGDRAFASADLAPGQRRLDLDVTALVRVHGGDVVLRRLGGAGSTFVSREGGPDAPVLSVTKRGDSFTLRPVADVALDRSTYRSLGEAPTLGTAGPVYLRFNVQPHPGITRAVLTLTSTAQYGAQKIAAFRADAAPPGVAMPAFPVARPDQILARWTGADWRRHRDWAAAAPGARVTGTILTAAIPRDDLTALALLQPLRGAGTEAFVTVVMRLHPDWAPPNGGKMPGFSNIGQGKGVVGGLGPAGWGGRAANGLRWSARTAFAAFDPAAPKDKTAFSTYFYALKPANIWGQYEPWALAVPRGRWFSYTQRVKLNRPQAADGELSYWLDGTPVYHKADIRWRDRGGPESEINEFWLNVYCGGTSCGPAVRDRAHAFSIASVTVAKAMPDPAAAQAEVDRLNAAPRAATEPAARPRSSAG